MNTLAETPSASATPRRTPRQLAAIGVIALFSLFLMAIPVYSMNSGDAYVLTIASRILAYALAAIGLNIVLGYGGMVSMGHAMYIGLGAYTVVLMHAVGVDSGWLQLLAMGLAVGVIAIVVGWISLRTQGIAFIMITLAFAQLFFFVFVSLKAYGGDEGMTLQQASDFGALTGNRTALYCALLACVGAALYGTYRMAGSRFGLVLRATRINERRVKAVGIPTLPYRLAAYVISAWVCALAGFFLANLTGFVSPAYLAWSVSGELIVMVVLGGVGTVVGPLVGALALLLFEEALKGWTEYWMMILGPLIVLMVLVFRRGLWGLLSAPHSDSDNAAEETP